MQRLPQWLKKHWRLILVFLFPLLFSPLAFTGIEGRCGYIIIVMSLYWVTEVLPIPVTALIPVFAFPVLGVISTKELTPVYMQETNMMFLGGLTVAIAVEYSNLHKRIALTIILFIGQSPRLLMSGFMVTTMFLSMWISNTASTAMMVPIVDAVLQELYKTRTQYDRPSDVEEDPRVAPHHQSKDQIATSNDEISMNNVDPNSDSPNTPTPDDTATVLFSPPPNEECRRLRDMCYLATAYAANLGGTGSLTGTGPNLVVKNLMNEDFPLSNDINFATWMAYNVPGMLICVFLAWIWLQFLFIGFSKKSVLSSNKETDARVRQILLTKKRALGPMSFHEVVVLVLFILLVLLWFFLSPGFMVGWGDLFNMLFPEIKLADATPVIFIVLLLFIIPRNPGENSKGGENACLTWKVVNDKVPWGIVLLLGGGLAMAKAADKSNMSVVIGEQLKALSIFPKEAILFLVSILTAMITEAASNTATASILLPVLKEMSLGINVNPIYLMLPTSICCSYAFMLPVATPPNAIALGASQMKTMTMVKAGFVMNIICVLVSTLMMNTLGVAMFDLHNFPTWANASYVNATAEFLE